MSHFREHFPTHNKRIFLIKWNKQLLARYRVCTFDGYARKCLEKSTAVSSVKKCTKRPYRGFVSPASLANFLSPDSMNESNEKKKSNSSLSRIVASDDFSLTFSAAFCVSATDKRENKFRIILSRRDCCCCRAPLAVLASRFMPHSRGTHERRGRDKRPSAVKQQVKHRLDNISQISIGHHG